jgi:hypothetical protein
MNVAIPDMHIQRQRQLEEIARVLCQCQDSNKVKFINR